MSKWWVARVLLMILWLFDTNSSPTFSMTSAKNWKELRSFVKESFFHPWPWHAPLVTECLWQRASFHKPAQVVQSLNAALCSPSSKTYPVTLDLIRSITSLTGLHISCILCFFLMLTSYFCFLSISSFDSSSVLHIHMCVDVFARMLCIAFALPLLSSAIP